MALTLVLAAWVIAELVFNFDVTTSHLVAGGIGVFIIVASTEYQRRTLKQFETRFANPLTPMTFHMSQKGMLLTDDLGQSSYSWGSVRLITKFDDATVIFVGSIAYPIPDSAVIDQMTPTVFRDRLEKFRQATL